MSKGMNYKGLDDIVRIGIVSSVDLKKCTARVTFPDREDDVSYDLPVIVRNTRTIKDYWMPEEEEEVLCIFLPNGEETGFILGSPYSEIDKPVPEISELGKKRHGIWINSKNYIKWVEEDNCFEIGTENPIRWVDT